ncbi:MAG: FapA family protein [Eubacterium sp.]|nr:FapA family protein [Eubacterium sp.]
MAEAMNNNIANKQASSQASVSAIDISPYKKAGFSRLQCYTIKQGLEAGLDVSVYAKKNLNALQMDEIRLGLADKVDVNMYAKPEYSSFQMKELRIGLKKGINVAEFATPKYEPAIIKAIVLAKERNIDIKELLKKSYPGKVILVYVQGKIDGVDLIKYVEKGLDDDQLGAFLDAAKEGINLDPYARLNLYGVQLREIMEGLKKEISVSVYANGKYNWMQMAELRQGIENGIDVKPYANPDFTHLQMEQIRLGLESRLDVSSYALVSIDSEKMAELREQVFAETGYEDQINKIYEGSAVADLINPLEGMPELEYDFGAEAEKLLEEEEVINPAVALAKELVGDIAEEIAEKERAESVIDEDDDEEVDEETKEDITVTVSEDKMKAYVSLAQPYGDKVYTIRDVTRALRASDVKQGISQDAINKLLDDKNYFVDVLVAEGKEPVKGDDGYFTFNFKKEFKATPKILPNGSVDYKGMELFETVNRGDVIVTYTPATTGGFGYNVLGEIVNPEKGKELPEIKGKGFHVSEDKKEYIADIKGIIEWTQDERIEIRNVYNVEGSVDVSTGNINFDGDVNVSGNVDPDFMITASGNVVIEGSCEGCSIFAGQDILIKGGCQGRNITEINAGGTIIGQFFESCKLRAGGDITCTYILNCDTITEGNLKVEGRRGVIIGGHTTAKTGVECFGIGNVAEVKSRVDVGVGEGDTKAYMEIVEKCTKIENDIKTLESGIEKIMMMEEKTEQAMEVYDKLSGALISQRLELEDLLQEREAAMAKMNRQRGAQIDVKGTVYPGSRIFVNSVPYIVRETLKNVCFLKENEKVGYKIRTKI